ncbi:hypothetical protein Celaphus_00017455, partial [Cervus elaphus hippelaphus]
MKMILDQLVTRGHDVTVLTSSVSILIDPNKPSAMKFETLHASLANDDYKKFIKCIVKIRCCFKQETYDKVTGIKVQGRFCRCHWTCGELLAEIFKIPLTWKNCIPTIIGTCYYTFNVNKWNLFYSKVLGRHTTLSETMGKAEMWFIRTFCDFEFPCLLLPNFEFVGGLHCKPAKSLPK